MTASGCGAFPAALKSGSRTEGAASNGCSLWTGCTSSGAGPKFGSKHCELEAPPSPTSIPSGLGESLSSVSSLSHCNLMSGRDVIKDDFGGKLPSGRPRPRLPRGRGFTRRRDFTVRRRGKNRIRADAKKNKNKNNIFGSCCRLGKRELFFQFSIFGFRFSIPKIPKLPELRGLRGRSCEKKKVFSA
jgi:hypothetical protein